ncbi:MAG: hypothetical protein IT211_14250 [Armatimonadetes bacterium]|nr:hypothetical protein [Armatimonadota bacterium]
MNASPVVLLSLSLVIVGGCCAIMRRNTHQVLLGQTLMVVGAVGLLLYLCASRIPSIAWFGLPLGILLVVGIRLFRQAVAHRAPPRHCSKTSG